MTWPRPATAAANQPAVFAARDSLHAAELKAATLNKGGLSALVGPRPADSPPTGRPRPDHRLGGRRSGLLRRPPPPPLPRGPLRPGAAAERRRHPQPSHRSEDPRSDRPGQGTPGRFQGTGGHHRLVPGYGEGRKRRPSKATSGRWRRCKALGLGPDCAIGIVGKELPDVHTKADRDTIVQLALTRRGEVIEATTAVGVFCLEVDAQGKYASAGADVRVGRRHPLHAAGRDAARSGVPAGSVGPGMPVSLPGNKAEPREIAEAYHARAPSPTRRGKPDRPGGRGRLPPLEAVRTTNSRNSKPRPASWNARQRPVGEEIQPREGRLSHPRRHPQ